MLRYDEKGQLYLRISHCDAGIASCKANIKWHVENKKESHELLQIAKELWQKNRNGYHPWPPLCEHRNKDRQAAEVLWKAWGAGLTKSLKKKSIKEG